MAAGVRRHIMANPGERCTDQEVNGTIQEADANDAARSASTESTSSVSNYLHYV